MTGLVLLGVGIWLFGALVVTTVRLLWNVLSIIWNLAVIVVLAVVVVACLPGWLLDVVGLGRERRERRLRRKAEEREANGKLSVGAGGRDGDVIELRYNRRSGRWE
jgi:hypothetical protein